MKSNLIFMLFLLFVSACANYRTAREIKNQYPRENTGIDQLIRINGYYFESSEEKYVPFVFTLDGQFKKYNFIFASHLDIHNSLNSLYPAPGSYEIENDTIKVKWAMNYDIWSYNILEEHLIVINDTTLQRVYYFIKTATTGEEKNIQKVSPERNIYKFHPFEVDNLKTHR